MHNHVRSAILHAYVDKRLAILIISDHSDPMAPPGGEQTGGQNVYVHNLASRLAEKHCDVHVFTRLNDPRRPLKEKSPDGYTVFRIPLGPEGFLPKEEFARYVPSFVQQIRAHADRFSYDVIHSHYWLSGLCAIAIKESHGIPVVHMFHSLGKIKHRTLRGIDERYQKEREEAEMRIVANADRIIAESNDERINLGKLYQADPDRITVIPAGVDIRHFSPALKEPARKELDLRERHVILYVGRFVAQKGLPTLLHAYAMLRSLLTEKERDETVLILVGGNINQKTEKESRIQKKIRFLMETYNLSPAIHMADHVPNAKLPHYYHAADFCVVPSRYEPFGIVSLEAMACGRPVIASFVGGMKNTVRNLYTGFHARQGSVTDFAYKMRILLQNPALCDLLGAQARDHVTENYSWDRVSDDVLACYHATINRG